MTDVPRAFIVLSVLACLSVPSRALATEWFVAPGGTGLGTATSPAGGIQAALERAQPGDTVTVGAGTYAETLRTVRDGSPARPIRLRASAPRGSVVISARGRVLRVAHADFVAEGLVFDGQYGPADTISVTSAAHRFLLRNSEVRRSSRDLVDLAAPSGVVIEGCSIHHALDATDGRTDAHGVVAGAVTDFTIRDTEIHTFSGDGLQVDPGRAAPGWNRVTVERTKIWLQPLPGDENGFVAGSTPGENGIDTKADPAWPRGRLVLRDVEAWGFRRGLIANMAAFNLKENVEVDADGVTVFDSEIAFRVRGPGTANRGGAQVTVVNAVVYDVGTAFRYEDRVAALRVWNATIDAGANEVFRAVQASAGGTEVRNMLILGRRPVEAAHPSNLVVGPEAFVSAATRDYRLAGGSAAIDTGVALDAVRRDRLGVTRPQGPRMDVGAFERVYETPIGTPNRNQ